MPTLEPMHSRRLTVEIVSAYCRKNKVGSTELPLLINTVHTSLNGLGQPVVEPVTLVPAVSIRKAATAEHVICLECGYQGKMLRRHLSSRHNLSPEQYRARWKLALDFPLTASSYSERRSRLAKDLGLGRKPGFKVETAPPPEPAASETASSTNTTEAGAATETAGETAGTTSETTATAPKRTRTRAKPQATKRPAAKQPNAKKTTRKAATKTKAKPAAKTRAKPATKKTGGKTRSKAAQVAASA